MNVKETLVAARKVIANPENWCKGSTLQTPDGECTSYVQEATKFCAIGAIHKALNTPDTAVTADFEITYAALTETLESLGIQPYVGEYNDSVDHPTILKLFDLAIERETLG